MSFIGKTLGKIVGHQSSKSASSPSNTTSTSPLSHHSPNTQFNFYNHNTPQLNHDAQLTLTHLRKVFYEYLHPKNELSQSSRDDKLYSILPLFIKAFAHCSLNDINDKFGDVGEFCFACSKLLCNEISKRVHDDLILVKFFEIKTSDDATDGSGLLNTVNLLASGPPFLVEIMTKCNLPSRLVMCVYLFICLPEAKDSILDHCEFNAKERRILFQKCFQQLLIKLCLNSCTCEELVEADSLKLLFKIISSTCEQHNLAWKQTATDALLTLTKNFNQKTIDYILKNECLQLCLLSLDPGEICSSNLIERANLLINLLSFLKETSFMTQSLLDLFKHLSGYKIIVDVILRLEKENRSNNDSIKQCLKHLFNTLEEFVSAGLNEIKPSPNASTNMFKIEGFQVPQPVGKGRSVRNTNAFQCLLHIFNRVQTNDLCILVLETIRNIYKKDEANYFILESQNLLFYSLDDSAIKIHNRNTDIQIRFLEILEFIVFGLKFVPCKELVSIGLSIQNYTCTKWSINCANFLLKIIKTNQVYKDAFRELGLLEMSVSCLQKFAVLLKEKHVDQKEEVQLDPQQKELGFLIMEIISCLLAHNSSNAKLFRELGGARVAHNMVPYKLCRTQALNIVSTLLLSTAGEDDMSTLLGLMHTAQMEDLELKNSVLKSLLNTLRESHRTRTVFRKAGGFVYVVSVLISMEGCLNIPAKPPWDNVKRSEVFSILRTIFNTLTVSMRYEPANAKFFDTEVRWKSLCAALRLLGCFDPNKTQFEARNNSDFVKRGFDVFENYFCTLDESCFNNQTNSPSKNTQIDQKLIFICYLMRLLYDTAIDAFDKPDFLVNFSESLDDRPFNRHANRNSQTQSSDSLLSTSNTSLKKSNSFSSQSNLIEEPFIIHPGAISSILHLLTSVPYTTNMAFRLQYHMINLIKNLLKYERNQQIMSNACFIDDLLNCCKIVLNDETHFLNSSIQHIFERLATQSISSKSLREYLRLGTIFDSNEKQADIQNSVLIPLNRVKCLISMTTPRDNKQFLGTSFVEFNMIVEGFGCLFLPSIAPQLSNAPSIVAMGMVSVGNDISVNGGVGAGERVFPPQSGLSFSTWVYIEKFGSNLNQDLQSNKQTHPIRLLTLIKHSKIKDVLTCCLSIYLSPKSRSLFICTEETLLQQQKFEDLNPPNDYVCKFNCSELFQEGQWLHICLVLTRAVLKNSSVSLYINSNLIGTQKLHYINSSLNSNQTPSSLSVHAVVGTLPMFRLQSPVVWRQASCYLIEDALSSSTVQSIYQLGPNYLGSFQSPPNDTNDSNSLISEEKIVFGLHPLKVFEMTLAKFRKVYNKNDSKSIGKQLNIPSNESVTPLRILSNTSAQLIGSARSVGGVVIGYMGVRIFQPMPVSKTIENVGGVSFLLGLIAMSNDIEFLYASVKAFVCVLKSNTEMLKEIERLNAYQLLAMLYKRKKTLINSHILNLTFSLAISDDNGKESSFISNSKAFEYLLCDLEIWYDCPIEIQRSLHEKFNDLLLNDPINIKLFHRLGMLKKLLFMIKSQSSDSLLKYVLPTVRILVLETSQTEDLVKFGQFLASLLPDLNQNEKLIDLNSSTESESIKIQIYQINLRNKLLSIIEDVVSQSTSNKTVNFQEDVQKMLGYDWFLLFLQPNVHKSTVIKSCKILFTLLLNIQNLNRFKESTFSGGWLSNIFQQLAQSRTQYQLQSQSTIQENQTIQSPTETDMNSSQLILSTIAEINLEACSAPGFQLMQVYFSKSPEYAEIYYLLFALLFDAQKIKDLTNIKQNLDLNSICKYVFDKSFDSSEQSLFCKINTDLSLDIIIILFSMIRTLMNEDLNEVTKDYAIILLQIFRFMYHNCDEFRLLSLNQDILSYLILTLYPYHELTPHQISLPTPTEIKPFAEAICTQDKEKTYSSFLSKHPARKLVLDFLRDLIYDSILTQTQQKTSLSLIDTVLISLPDNSFKRNQEFLTELFKTLTDYLLSTDLFNEHSQSSQLNNVVLQNFFNFIDRLVDKLWDGLYRREPREVFDVLVKFLNNLKKKNHQPCVESLISSINRTLLYQLSRPCDTLNEQIQLFDTLNKINKMKNLIFSSSNIQAEFFACLTYCLLKITEENLSETSIISLDTDIQSKTRWYTSPAFNETINLESAETQKNARALLTSAAQRVWLDLYLNKKSNLEECLKVSLSSNGKNPTLDQLRPVLTEPASRIWFGFIEGEKKLPEKIQNQIQAKFQRVTGGISTMAGGITRVVSLKKPKKEITRLNMKDLNEIINTVIANLMALKDYIENEHKKLFRFNEQKHTYLYSEWLKIEKDLLRERSLWGEDGENKLNKWKLDFTEGPNRQRKRLLPNNEEFYRNYPYRAEIDSLKPNRKYKIPSSFDSKDYYRQFKVKSLINYNQNISEYLQTQVEINQQLQSQSDLQLDQDLTNQNETEPDILKKSLNKSINNNDSLFIENEENSSNQTQSQSQTTSPNQNISRLLEDGEKINHIYRCARVTGLDTTEGVFLFGKEHFYVLDGYTLISTKDIVEIDSLKGSAYEPLIPKCGGSTSSSSTSNINLTSPEKTCSKFAYEEIREVHNRRYLLQEIAMEIFSNDGRNYLLVFPRKCRNKIYDRLIALTPELNDSASQSIAGQRRSINIEQNSGIFNALIGEKSVVQRWERGEITNFQYLMFLNTLAGRSYNDLMQYPVFPWILADYDSDDLDFYNPNTFRDLSKPMGAQTQDRLKQFEKRFLEWEDPSGETPPYHYGTHYSSAMIVASYLVRIEPFTQIFLRLQGGHFDLADRMFHSIKDSWLSASKNNMADVKELIPEFFYLPDFMVNSNKFDLGKKQSGVVLNDIVLPPWAKNDPKEFIRVHRMALESDYVSAHLNEWIDLIFGFKQQGQPAIESMNVFHHLFYEGAVNIDEIDDPLRRNAIIGFINNFGQIPKQLFKKPHPVKKLNSQILYGLASNLIGSSLGSTAANLVNVSSLASNLNNLQNNNQSEQVSIQSTTSLDRSQQPVVFINYLKSLKPSLQPVKELKSQIGQIVSTDKGILVVEQNKFLMPPSYQRYIAWGFTDESIKIGYTDYERSYVTFENIQDGAIFCCCSPDSKIIITAGTSTCVNVWELSKYKSRRLQLKTRLYGHLDTVTCMAVSNSYHMLVSGSRDQSCIIWDINRWIFVRQLPNHYGAVCSVCINESTGEIATASSTYLYLWNINGDLLASINTITSSRNHLVLCVCMSQVNEWDSNNVIMTGGTDGVVRMWSLGYTQVKDEQDAFNSPLDLKLNLNQSICSPSSNLSSSSGVDSSIQISKDNNKIKFFPENFDTQKIDSSPDTTSNNKPIFLNNFESDTEVNPNWKKEIEDEFVLIDSSQFKRDKQSSLKPGYKWKRELIFRSKLTMHTSYDRKDNSDPASVTAISISKDNKTIYVGDSRGRVYSWVCNENPGKNRADHWVKDDLIEQCKLCNVKFSFSERKHHCRDCGGVYCNNCSKYETEIPRLHINRPVRVCKQCYNQIKSEEANTSPMF